MDNVAGFDILILLFSQIDLLLLIFVRILAFFLMLPIISSQNVFAQGRIFLALTMSIAIFMSGIVTNVYYTDTVPGYIYLLLIEFLVGMAMGYATFAAFNLIFFAGQLMDFQIGLMMVNVMDPMTQIQVPVTGNLFYFGVLAMLVVSGGLHVLFGTFFYGYLVLPMGSAWVIGNEQLAWYFVLLLTQTMVFAVRIAMPIVGTMMVVNIALGIMVKTVPQMNVFVVGLPLKLLLGLFILVVVMLPNLDTIFWQVFDLAHTGMMEAIWGMYRQ